MFTHTLPLQDYDYNDYIEAMRSKPVCGEDSTTTATLISPTTTPETVTEDTAPECSHIHFPDTNITLSGEELRKALDQLVAHLTVNAEDLSKVKRSKISAPDDRVSSTTVGLFSITFIGVITGLVIVLDVSKLVSDCRLAVGNLS